MKKKIKQYLVLLIGIIILAFGNAFPIVADLGVAPISAPPYTFSLITNLSVGNMIIIFNTFYLILQILLLRKDFKLIQLLQLPIGIVFGYMIDLALILLKDLNTSTFYFKLLWCLLGVVIMAVGVSIEVSSNTIALAGDKLTKDISDVFKLNFSKVKIGFDIVLVIISGVSSYIFLGKIEGLGIGTILAAFLTGIVIKFVDKGIKNGVDKFVGTKDL